MSLLVSNSAVTCLQVKFYRQPTYLLYISVNLFTFGNICCLHMTHITRCNVILFVVFYTRFHGLLKIVTESGVSRSCQ